MKRIIAVIFLISGTILSAKAPVRYTARALKSYPHDVSSYTQGLFFHGGRLYESTGQYGESAMKEVNLDDGKALRKVKFTSKYFLEGSTILGDNLYILSWTNKVAFVYDAATLEYRSTYRYPREGWGLTTDGVQLIASDGSSRLYFMDGTYRQTRTVEVTLNGRPMRYLNELEWIDGRIWANVYLTDTIVIINPDSGVVEGVVDCRNLYPAASRDPHADVLNGIARSDDGRIYVTGKYWPRMYEIAIEANK